MMIAYLCNFCLSIFGDIRIFKHSYTDKNITNPYIGWAPSAEYINNDYEYSLVYASIMWNELEPYKEQYKFEEIEKKFNFNYWAKRNVKVIIRLVLDNPGEFEHIDIPMWLYNELNGDGVIYNIEYGRGFSPDYNNKTLIGYHQKLLKKMGERYNKDPRIAFVILGSIGHWGEWHTTDDLTVFPKKNITDQYVEHYRESFPDKKLLMRRPHDIASRYDIGLYNDMIGDEEATTHGYLNWIKKGYRFWLTNEFNPPMPEFWKYGPSGGEFAEGNAKKYVSKNRIDHTLEQIKNSHISWIGPCSAVDIPYESKYKENIQKVQGILGYKFWVERMEISKTITTGKEFDMTINWKNSGIAPFYYDWPIEFSLVDSKSVIKEKFKSKLDIKNILPGSLEFTDRFILKNKLSPGRYNVYVAIIDPGTGEPGVKFAMGDERADLRYKLGYIDLE